MSVSFKSWLLGVVCVAMLAAIAECLVPDGGAKRVLKIIGGMVLVLAIIKPLSKLDGRVLDKIVEEYDASARKYRDELQETKDNLYESIIGENAAAYILDKAEAMGVSCSVSVTVAWDGEVPCLQAVRIKGMWTAAQREHLSSIIEQDLGIPVALQYFEESGL